MDVSRFVGALAEARIGGTYNQYAEGPRAALLRERLARYLAERTDAPILLVGEAAGYRGARVSGIPFTSERQLSGSGPAEATATIVHRALGELGLTEDVLLWNVVPTHPGTASTNRPPTHGEVELGVRFLEPLAAGRTVIAVGRVAERALGLPCIRHPSHGGAKSFRRGLASAMSMSRTQIYLGERERELLERESRVTGASISELIRRAIRSTYRLELTTEEKLQALERSFGSWKDRDFMGAECVDAIRRPGDLNERLRRLGLD